VADGGAGAALATPLGDGAWLLDTRYAGSSACIAAYLVPQSADARRFDLVEAGPAVSVGTLEDAIVAAGFEPGAVDRVLVTHIHLDHAGGAGTWARRWGARVVADRRGAPHLIDPSRLLASARRVYGDALEERWGLMEPIAPERLEAVDDGDDVVVGGRSVRVLHTPGHASHHVAFLWPDGAAYVGDAAGVRLPPSGVVRPALPPPETDLEAAEASLRKLAEAAPERLRLTHFGQVDDVQEHLRAVAARNRAWAEAILAFVAEGRDPEAALDVLARGELEAEGADEGTIQRHLATSDAAMTVAGVTRYWRKHHPERWAEAGGG
jgi:glyoxylase-like metal-dependent hydrolase (beta-lactamase superfamily II)